MDLSLTDEQQLLVESARVFVARECPAERVRAVEAGDGGHDPALWRAMAELGWPGLVVPEEHGGAGRGMTDLALVCEELGRGAVPSPLVVCTTLAALPLVWAGSAEQRRRWLPALARGEVTGTLAVLEPGMADEWGPVGLRGDRPLVGTKVLVPWLSIADLVLVATTGGLRLVEAGAPRVGIISHDAPGGDPLAAMTFDGPPSEPLGDGDGGRGILDRALDHAAVAQLAHTVGVAEAMLELAVRHAGDRRQFGRPIGAFQAVAHRCADMRADVDACRYLAYQAAWALESGGPADAAVAAAKSYANEAVRRVAMHAHQVHGAMGFSTEHDLHLFTRRAKAFELSYGGTAHHRERLATAMGLRR